MAAESDEDIIRVLPASNALPPNEIYSWGLIRWHSMTREEFEERFPKPEVGDSL